MSRPLPAPDPLIQFITYSTPGRYREMAQAMIRSAGRVGVDVHHYEEKPFKRWRDALYHKAIVIKRAFDDFPNSHICWIDADATFYRHPTSLYAIAPQRHVAAYCERQGGGLVLWGGTLWFRRSEISQKLIDLWIKENKKAGRGFIDDNNLLHTIMKAKMGAVFERLTPEYFWVEEFYRRRFPGCSPIVVQHCQGMGGDQSAKNREAPIRPWMGGK